MVKINSYLNEVTGKTNSLNVIKIIKTLIIFII